MHSEITKAELVAGDAGWVSFEHQLGHKPTTIIPSNLDDRFAVVPGKDGAEPTVDVDLAPFCFQLTAFDETTVEGIVRSRDTGEPAPTGTRFNLGWAVQ